ncbi:OmpA family protein [Shewanella fidelis]|uniref:OmpA family protein n=1 Tax=Shewanella fidelis TaxID=173509 RepID=UPI00049161CA|nr:OmpA family protein [Shewanella fidelis]
MRIFLTQLLFITALLLQGCAETAAPFAVAPQTRDLLDSDTDGVINARDKCAATSKGAIIDNDGCPSPNITVKEDFRVIMFGFDRDTLDAQQADKWRGIIGRLAQKQSPSLYLVGDTSVEGSEDYNHALAKRRVEYITQLAVEQGFPAEAIKEEVYYKQNHIPQAVSGREHRLIAVATWQESGTAMMWNIYTSERSN